MRSRRTLTIVAALLPLLFLLLLSGAPPASGQVRPQPPKGPFRPGAVLVKFKPSVPEAQRRLLLVAAEGAEETASRRTGMRRIAVPRGREMEKVALLRGDPDVEYAEPDYLVAAAWTPNDTYYSSQWGLPKISAPLAWDRVRGEGVTVAVVDTGVDLSHPDLQANIVPGYDFVNGDATADDDNGHGTHVAGIVAAIGNNARGVIGVAPLASIMPVKVLDSTGSGYYSDLVQGIQFAADNGARVINMSLGGTAYSQAMRDAVDYAWSRGAVVVAAAGNAASDEPLYPAAYSNAIAVAATTSSDAKASFSNFGSYVDIAAPGYSILSTYKWSGYAYMSGTSMATPFVSGLAALVFSTTDCGTIDNSAVRQAIENGADNIDGANLAYAGQLGRGRVNAASSVPQPLTLGTNIVSFLVEAGDGRPAHRSVAVATGTCPTPWTAGISSMAPQSGWLNITTNSGATPSVRLTANPDGLGVGRYTANVGVNYVGAPSSSQRSISVLLEVAPQLFRTTVPALGRNAS